MKSYITRCQNRERQEGVIMVMIPVIMLLLGLLVAYLTRSVGGPDFYKEQATRDRMDEIAVAVSSYVQRYNRLPCPADPNSPGPEPLGFEIGSGATGGNIPAGACGVTEGLVPVHTLGLTFEYMRDDWGKNFTYAVSSDFTVAPVVDRYDSDSPTPPALPAGTDRLPRASAAANMQVHNLCRISTDPAPENNWIDTGRNTYRAKNGNSYDILGRPVDIAINPFKARFCCAAPFNPDIIVNVSGAPTPTRDAAAANYARADNTVLDVGTQAETVVFALISHGANGWGAFMRNAAVPKHGTNNAGIVTVPLGANETENADGDLNFADFPKALGDTPATYYDDIVMHFTQNQIYGHLGDVDCRTPY
jgi:hypothetical protein